MNIWLTMIAAGLLTYALRLSFIVLVGNREIPSLLRQALRYIPAAVLTAILTPELLIHSDRIDFSLGNARLLAGLLAIVVAWRTRSAMLTIIVGMLALWGILWLQR
jgi:branched-subunit amino acid transport protein